MNQERLNRILKEMEKSGVSQMVITNPYSINYVAGHLEMPMERFWALFVSTETEPCLLANRLFTLDEVEGIEICWYEDGEDGTAILKGKVNPEKPLGIDDCMRAQFLLQIMKSQIASSYIPTSDCVDKVRAIKDAEELRLMRIVSEMNDKAMAQFRDIIKIGMTEKQVAGQMLEIYQSLGADDYSFSPLVGFGGNAACGHHGPDDTILKKGDCVLLDVGCIAAGYCADMTRTFFAGEVSEEQRKVYQTVLEAQVTAENAIKPGVALSEIDGIARKIITDAGYGPYFTHRLGHFIGVEVHEKGDVSPKSDLIAVPGMVFSIEPGIYLPGNTGVRIEDLVTVTEGGVEILNHYTKELQIICG